MLFTPSNRITTMPPPRPLQKQPIKLTPPVFQIQSPVLLDAARNVDSRKVSGTMAFPIVIPSLVSDTSEMNHQHKNKRARLNDEIQRIEKGGEDKKYTNGYFRSLTTVTQLDDEEEENDIHWQKAILDKDPVAIQYYVVHQPKVFEYLSVEQFKRILLPVLVTEELTEHDYFEIFSRNPVFINMLDEEGQTPLMCAVKLRNYEAANALFSLGADINIINLSTYARRLSFKGLNIIHYLVLASQEDFLLNNAEKKPNKSSSQKRLTEQKKCASLLKMLLFVFPNEFTKDPELLFFIEKFGNVECLEIFIEELRRRDRLKSYLQTPIFKT